MRSSITSFVRQALPRLFLVVESSCQGIRIRIRKRSETAVFLLALVVLNISVLSSGYLEKLIYVPDQVRVGEWWRLITHPFVHVSWYHFLLDSSAFILLYDGLLAECRSKRFVYVLGGAAGALTVSSLTSSKVGVIGLCGLSGIAHGLMVISGLEMISFGRNRAQIIAGSLSLLIIISKSVYEAVTGKAFLAGIHFGLLGTPIPQCHLGGVVGGAIVFFLYVLVDIVEEGSVSTRKRNIR